MAILALDLGTKLGWALGSDAGTFSGTQLLHPSKHDSYGMRFLRFTRFLQETHESATLVHIGYEKVRRHAGTEAAHVYGALEGHLHSWAETADHIPVEGFEVGEIKTFWTGKGNASKDAMIAAAKERGFNPLDDNEADALAILHMMGWGS